MLTDADFAKGLTLAQIRNMTAEEREAAKIFLEKQERQECRMKTLLSLMGIAMAVGAAVCIWVYAMLLVEIAKKAHGL